MGTPPAVASITLLVVLRRRGLVGQFQSVVGIEMAFTSAAISCGSLFVVRGVLQQRVRAGYQPGNHARRIRQRWMMRTAYALISCSCAHESACPQNGKSASNSCCFCSKLPEKVSTPSDRTLTW